MEILGELRELKPVEGYAPLHLLAEQAPADVLALVRSFVFVRVDAGELNEGLVLDIGGHQARVLLLAEMADLFAEDSRKLKSFVSDLDPQLKDELLTGSHPRKRGAEIKIWGDENVH